MKTEKQIRAMLDEILSAEQLKSPTATVFANAPLALMQMGLSSKANILKWALEPEEKA